MERRTPPNPTRHTSLITVTWILMLLPAKVRDSMCLAAISDAFRDRKHLDNVSFQYTAVKDTSAGDSDNSYFIIYTQKVCPEVWRCWIALIRHHRVKTWLQQINLLMQESENLRKNYIRHSAERTLRSKELIMPNVNHLDRIYKKCWELEHVKVIRAACWILYILSTLRKQKVLVLVPKMKRH